MKRSGWILLGGYALVTLALVCFHEPWRDELQAWLIARHLSIVEIWHEMRYEGHFAWWFLMLRIGAAAGWPVWTMNLLSWALCLGAAWLLTARSPFRRWEQAAILLSAGMLYWFPAVARCYALIPLLLFALAAAWPERRLHPWRIGLLTALLTQTHAYMEGLAAMIFLEAAIGWFSLPRGEARRRAAGALGLMALGALVGFLQVWPAFRCASGANLVPLPDAAAWYDRLLKVTESFAEGFGGGEALWGAAAPVMTWLCWLVPLAALGMLAAVSRRAAWIAAGGWLWQFGFAFFLYEYIPQRSALAVLILIFGAWIALAETSTGGLRRRLLRGALAATVLWTVPGGIAIAAADLRHPYSGVREAGAFLDRESPPSLPVFLYPYSDRTAAAAAYAPRHAFFSLVGGRPCPFYHRTKYDIASVCFEPEFLDMSLAEPLPAAFLLLTNGDYFPEGETGEPFEHAGYLFKRVYRTPFVPLEPEEQFRIYLVQRR